MATVSGRGGAARPSWFAGDLTPGRARAAGVFAPGHLGELTRIVPFELAGGVLGETGTRERRQRVLPARVGV